MENLFSQGLFKNKMLEHMPFWCGLFILNDFYLIKNTLRLKIKKIFLMCTLFKKVN
jgi:hypothetical protein